MVVVVWWWCGGGLVVVCWWCGGGVVVVVWWWCGGGNYYLQRTAMDIIIDILADIILSGSIMAHWSIL